LVRKRYFVRYSDIKFTTQKRYPFSHFGNLIFEVTGEEIIQSQDTARVVSNSFSFGFAEDVAKLHSVFDQLMLEQISLEDFDLALKNVTTEENICASYPHVVNTIVERFVSFISLNAFVFLIFFVSTASLPEIKNFVEKTFWSLIPGLVILNVLYVLYLVVYAKMIQYTINKDCIAREWGILYRRKTSLHFCDIDYIGKKQGAINKFFQTGNVTVNTVGSSQTDLRVANVPDYVEFYNILQRNYQKAIGKSLEDASEKSLATFGEEDKNSLEQDG
jgi:membrane protein YdbS with pleckstrin-like domain